MKLAVYSLITPDYRVQEAAELIAEIGYDGVEWTVDYTNAMWDGESNWHIDTGNLEESAQAARDAADSCGLEVTGLGTRCNCFDLDGVRTCMKVAQIVGAPAIRVAAPGYDGSTPFPELFDRARDAYAEIQTVAADHGVKAAIETHNGLISPSASAARRLLEGLDPEWIGVLHDPGNMVREGMENWKMGIEMLAPYIAEVHVKDLAWFRDDGEWHCDLTPLGEGMVDWPAVVGALREVGYDGYLTDENFLPGWCQVSEELPTRQLLEQDYRFLRSLL